MKDKTCSTDALELFDKGTVIPRSERIHVLRADKGTEFICVCWPHERQCLQHLYIFSSTRKHSSLPGYPLHSVTNPILASGTQPLCHRAGVYHNIRDSCYFLFLFFLE